MAHLLYARVSTKDQTIQHQRTQAEKELGIQFDDDLVIFDDGVSGVSTRLNERVGGQRLLEKARKGDVVVVRWIDRLGRNYGDVVDVVRAFMKKGVIVKTIINRMTFDGSLEDPTQQAIRDALLGFMAAMSQAQAEATKEAQAAGIAHAKADEQKYKGRKPSFTAAQIELIQKAHQECTPVAHIARDTNLSRAAVYRILEDAAKANAIVTRWKEQPITA